MEHLLRYVSVQLYAYFQAYFTSVLAIPIFLNYGLQKKRNEFSPLT